MTMTVNIGGDSKAWQAIVTGTGLSGLIVTGTVWNGVGSNLTVPPGTVYQYFTLVPARYGSITKSTILFTVPQSWLDGNHISPGSIVLYHRTADSWEPLPTTVLPGKDGTASFSAQSAGFSLFAIAGTPAEPAPLRTEAPPEVVSTPVLQQEPAATGKTPAAVQTPVQPATAPQPSAPSPLTGIVSVVASIGLFSAGGSRVRRWWICRQDPALFREYE
jgi:hypothetical protein